MGAVKVNPPTVTEEVYVGTLAVNANSSTYTTKAIPAKSGYKVGGVTGITWSHPSVMLMSVSWKSGQDAYIAAHSFYGASLTEAITLTVLYLPN